VAFSRSAKPQESFFLDPFALISPNLTDYRCFFLSVTSSSFFPILTPVIVMPAAAEHALFTIRFDKQHRKNYVAETAGQPYGYKKNDENTRHQNRRHRLIGVHHNMHR
jgi:hypothetical protein